MAKRTKAQEGDRVVHLRTGETGTIMSVHSEVAPKGSPPNYSVLRDTGLRVTTVWKGAEAQWEYAGARKCFRCGEDDHTVLHCPYGDLDARLTTEGRAALVALGLDPRRQPGAVDGEDAYDGIRLWAGPGNKDYYRRLRRRVCEHEGVIVDGHDFNDGTCRHCGKAEA